MYVFYLLQAWGQVADGLSLHNCYHLWISRPTTAHSHHSSVTMVMARSTRGKAAEASVKATSTTMAQASIPRKPEADLALDLSCFNCRLQLHKGSHNAQKILCNSKDFRIHHDPKLDRHRMWKESRVCLAACLCCVPGLHCSLGSEHGTRKLHTAHAVRPEV